MSGMLKCWFGIALSVTSMTACMEEDARLDTVVDEIAVEAPTDPAALLCSVGKPRFRQPMGAVHENPPTFCWSHAQNADWYDVFVLITATDEFAIDPIRGVTSNCVTPDQQLPWNTPMRWRVRAHAACGASQHADGSAFFVIQ